MKVGFAGIEDGSRIPACKEDEAEVRSIQMNELNILILNKNPHTAEYLKTICRRVGAVSVATDIGQAIQLIEKTHFQVLIADASLGCYPLLRGLFKITTSIVIIGEKEEELKKAVGSWPLNYYVDFIILPQNDRNNGLFLRTLSIAADYSRLKAETEKLRLSKDRYEAELKDAISEIKEIKEFIQRSVVKEIEKRVSVEAKYIGIKKEKQRIEETLKKLYMANDVTSLLDIVYDIKEIVHAGGISLYILDENETLGKYLKPLVWDDAFLSHPEFSKHFVLIDSDDFAACATRQAETINTARIFEDKRFSRRYAEQLREPLRSILCTPIIDSERVIGVLEVYNKKDKDRIVAFSVEDENAMRRFSEHISIAITKLNLIQYDALTGLLRPDPFFEKVVSTLNLERKRLKEGPSYAMVMGDVDWFKHYNDRFGHEAGNKLLRELAVVLKSSIRDDDLLCRYGGEEFLFFLSGLNSEDEASGLTERIRKNIEEYHFPNQDYQPNNNLTMSFGLTFFSRDRIRSWDAINKNNLKKLANEADRALALAKGKKTSPSGIQDFKETVLLKNRVCVFDRTQMEEEGKLSGLQPFQRPVARERRKHKRVFTSTILIYKKKDFHKVTKTINMSLGGIKFPTESKLDIGHTLDLILILGNNACQLKGDVVYSDLAGEDYFHYYTGLKFRDLSPRERQVLEDYFSSMSLERKGRFPH